ncbi:MAG TPA: MarR family winged helix-turn-helix transcriptional regulator [Dermatophilaceae bacterium]|nr:MarR family winged helix-turn-helix transcriptional regulator [Dermatophilaceae bacterium]
MVSDSGKAAPEPPTPERPTPEPPTERPHTAYVEQWRRTESLRALKELIDVSAAVPPAVAARAALTHHELTTLEHLMRGPVGPVELARVLRVTSAASSGIVDRLCARGHVVREPHPSDGRRTQVVLTPSGREEVLGHLVPMFAALDALDSRLSEGERRVVADYLRGAIDAMHRLL